MMVADSRITGDGAALRTRKIFEVNGKLVGCCGTWTHSLKFVEWMKNGKEGNLSLAYDKEGNTFSALVMDGGFLELYDNELIPAILNEEVYAIGSGSSYALGALDAGASPKRAVEIAISRDELSGGPVQVVRQKL